MKYFRKNEVISYGIITFFGFVCAVSEKLDILYNTSTHLGPFLWLFSNIWRHKYDVKTVLFL